MTEVGTYAQAELRCRRQMPNNDYHRLERRSAEKPANDAVRSVQNIVKNAFEGEA